MFPGTEELENARGPYSTGPLGYANNHGWFCTTLVLLAWAQLLGIVLLISWDYGYTLTLLLVLPLEALLLRVYSGVEGD